MLQMPRGFNKTPAQIREEMNKKINPPKPKKENNSAIELKKKIDAMNNLKRGIK